MLSVAPNGGRRTLKDHPALPLTPAALARTAAECLEAGANLLHVHVRDAQGKHTLSPEAYREAFDAIRQEVGQRLVLQATTEALGLYTPAEQMAAVRGLQPESVSIAVRELFGPAAAPARADDRELVAFLSWLEREQIMVQYIVYDASDEQRLRSLVDQGVVAPTFWTLYVLGAYGAARSSSPPDLLKFAVLSGAAQPWAVCAFGPGEAACALAAAAFGGHIRIGFENNLQRATGEQATSNAAQVQQLRSALDVMAIAPMTADELRHAWQSRRG